MSNILFYFMFKPWKHKQTKCKCNFPSWIRKRRVPKSEQNTILSNIRGHIYDHMFHLILPNSCISIVELYVGELYYSKDYSITLGLIFINHDDLKKIAMTKSLSSESTYCKIKNCGARTDMWTLRSGIYVNSLCDEHYNQFVELPIIHTHNHECDICYTNYIRIKKNYMSMIMKLNSTICYNIANIIQSFCFTKLPYKCRGHFVSKDYECCECFLIEKKIDVQIL
jgi:hypothetical protein